MAKVTSPAPAKSGQAKIRGTTKAPAANTATPDETVAGTAPAAVAPVDPAAPVVGTTQIQDGEPNGSTSTENALQDGTQPPPGDTGAASAGNPAGEHDGAAAQPVDGAGDGLGGTSVDSNSDGEEPPLPILSAKLVNHSNMSQRIVKARRTLAPGESAVIEFRDDKHREQCEKHVAQIRSLYRWADGEGLHWSEGA